MSGFAPFAAFAVMARSLRSGLVGQRSLSPRSRFGLVGHPVPSVLSVLNVFSYAATVADATALHGPGAWPLPIQRSM